MVDVPRNRPSRYRRWLLAAAVVVGTGTVLSTLAFATRGEPTLDVPKDAARIAEVSRGPMTRAVRGPGTLVPQDVHWVTAVTSARVDSILVEPGTSVEAGTLLLVLRNPDVELAALESRSELAAAEAELANLEASLDTDRLAQEAVVATVKADHLDATRKAATDATLSQQGAVAGEELARARERAEELDTRLGLEHKRLRVLGRAKNAQVAAQRARVEQLRAVVEFRSRQIAELELRAPKPGALQEVEIEVGQWVTPGTVLAKLIDPTRLEAELRIPEVQAKDVQVEQHAVVDTRNGEVRGKVVRIEPAVQGGAVTVTVRFDEPLPRGARADLSVDGRVELEHIEELVQVRRPAGAEPGRAVTLFRVDEDGELALRTRVQLGRASVETIEVVSGLSPGDRVIVSDTTAWDDAEVIRLR